MQKRLLLLLYQFSASKSVQLLLFNMKVDVFVALIILPATLYIVICSLAKNKYSEEEFLQIFILY